jgi:uncharacterized protein YyaL (SSP411 family)
MGDATIWELKDFPFLPRISGLLIKFISLNTALTQKIFSLIQVGILMKEKGKRPNQLINEKSPYLLQHAYNPVNWHPWGDEAFERARKEDKPIFLSIGYSTCHWCHVMERESFEDEEVAKLMNDAFVSIKVDREERPDIDGVYMKVCQLATGSGGWPLTIIMTPDKQPFFTGTYIPKKARFNRVGMLELIPRIDEMWRARRNDLLSSANEMTKALNRVSDAMPGKDLDESVLNLCYRGLTSNFDNEYGGFGVAPKFPTPHNLLFLLRYWKKNDDLNALKMVEKTLQAMRQGGIYDHVGFGFHRYSTDFSWFVPHFEKMLYDQALIALAYIEAFQATGKKEFEETAREIFTYVLRDMTSEDGGFYSAEDADSEGEEGKFYVWNLEEVDQVLTNEEAELARKIFNLEKRGNFLDEATQRRTGNNILHLKKAVKNIAQEMGASEDVLKERLTDIRKKLFDYREKRIHPLKDDKILTDWNGLMIAALAKGARVFEEGQYTKAASKSFNFILNNLKTQDGRLLHRYRDGDAAIPAHLDDYAFLVWGSIELFETTFDLKYLRYALELTRDMIKHFRDEKNGSFYSTADDAEELLVRQKEVYDGARPSGNSVAMLNLLRLARITGDSDLEEKAHEIGRTFSGQILQSPTAHTLLLSALNFSLGPTHEVVIVGNMEDKETKEMLKELRKRFIPNKVVILKQPGQSLSGFDALSKFLEPYVEVDGKTTAYVCANFSCKQPTTEIATMLKQLNENL